ncbi:ABC transporter ATP-binding protein [Frigidibacter sp. ROC022]|uniref:ABC transporter ATP-binding protein n=1 Tax=Frigidibacter sp. ROC022 TaxID=2971796 RepID=UPI00215A3295|nr:ABC transporter ATP-binding protein [Frigidibacter sp. ROC022]MCR8722751.1 ABC transporter ATP-binding protein [Frigidibacter sp. ROC022]
MAGLTIRNLSKTFGQFEALKDVSITVKPGEFLAVLGPSGCGKTTLLRMIAGFEHVSGGEIEIDGQIVSRPGKEVPPNERRIGIVFQNYALWPHMTVAENVGYSLRVAKVEAAEAKRRVDDALALVNLDGMGDRAPANLSGGQRQRVALARCLVAEPKLVLFDEPLANLDVHLRASMEDEFAAFHERTGTTVVYITHDQAEAMALADRIAVMDHGKLMQLDTPQTIYHRPANEMVASFISQGMVMPVTVTSAEVDGFCNATLLGQPIRLSCAPGDGPRDGASVCCRAEHVRIAEPGSDGIDGRIKRVVYQGGAARIEFVPDADAEMSIQFDQPDPQPFATGDRARIQLTGGWLIPAKSAD